MHITSKGQVTIPLAIRKKMGFLPDTEVEFALENGKVVVRKQGGARRRGTRVVAALRGRGNVKMTTDEIMAHTRGGH